MSEEAGQEAGSLPVLKPKRRDDPFSRNMAAILDGGSDTAGDPMAHISEAPASKPLRGKAPAPDPAPAETSRVHARIPTELMIELQVYCARNRTTMQDVIHKLVADFVGRRAK